MADQEVRIGHGFDGRPLRPATELDAVSHADEIADTTVYLLKDGRLAAQAADDAFYVVDGAGRPQLDQPVGTDQFA